MNTAYRAPRILYVEVGNCHVPNDFRGCLSALYMGASKNRRIPQILQDTPVCILGILIQHLGMQRGKRNTRTRHARAAGSESAGRRSEFELR